MIKEYKLPGLYVLGVPEKSLISFVTFSLSLLVLTISYLLYFYFRGCPVELALLPPVDKLGDPVEIAYDAVDEMSGKEIVEDIAVDAIKTDPGEKPSFVARFLGIFKKSKVPEEVIQEPKSEEDATMELKEDTPEEPILEEAIQDTEVQPDQAEVVAETDVPDVQTEEAIEEESVSIKDKIVEFFKPTESAVEETEEQLIEEEEPIVSEEESLEESTSIKDKIVGFFKKAEEAKVETVIEESEDKDVAVEMHADDNILEETTAEKEIVEDKPSIKDTIVGFFQKSETVEEEVVDKADQEVVEEETVDANIIPEESTDEGSLVSAETEATEETPLEDMEENSTSIKDKIVGFFQSTEDVDIEPEIEQAVVKEETVEPEEIPTEVSAEDESSSIKEKIVGFFQASEEAKTEAEPAIVEEPVAKEETDVSEQEIAEPEEIGEIEETAAVEAELEGSCEDLPEDKTLREKIWNFFGCENEAAPADESAATEEVIEEPEELPSEVEEVAAVVEEASEEVPVIETPESEDESSSIKDKIVGFFQVSEEVETQSEPVNVEEALAEEETEVVEQEVPETEEIGEIEETIEPAADLEGSCEDLPEDKSLREKIWNFFGCEDKLPAPVDVEEPEDLPIEIEEVLEVVDEASLEEIPAENSIKAAVQSFLGTKEETAEDVVEAPIHSDELAAETVEVDSAMSDELEIVPEIDEANSIKATLRNILSGSEDQDMDAKVEEAFEEEAEESVADVPVEIFVEATVEGDTLEEVMEEEATVEKPSFKERILNFFKRSKPAPEVVPVEEITEVEEIVPEVEVKEVKESLKTRIGNFFNIFQSKTPVTDLETEIAEAIVDGNLKEMMKNSEKEPIVVDTIGLCPEITRENWLQLFMGRSFLCFVSFSLNLSVLIASYLLYF